jgi:predicted neuraminidase
MKNLLFPFLLLIAACSGMPRSENNRESLTTDSILIENIFPFQKQHCHGSTIVELPNKDLLAAWFQGSGERTADDVAIMGSRYNHTKRQWEKPFIMADVPGFPDINPVLFIDGSSRLWLVWYTVMAYQWETSLLKYRISENFMNAGAPEWKWQDMIHMKPDGSSPDGIGKNDSYVATLSRKYEEYHTQLIKEGYIKKDVPGSITEEMWNMAVARSLDIAKGTNLISNGTDLDENGAKVKTRLGYPLMRRIGWQTRNKPLVLGKKILLPLYSDGFDHSLIAITENGGQTWSFSEPIVGAGNVQPSLVLCKDSTIVAYMRDNGPPPQRLMKSFSEDSGRTWSTVEDTNIPNPGSGADLTVLKSGNWIVVHNDLEEGRNRLSVWLSNDEGKSWFHRKEIIPGGNMNVRAHYPAIIQGSDGTIHVSFTYQVSDTAKTIAHASFSEKWLLKMLK